MNHRHPTLPGERYLVTIECDTPAEDDQFDCPARVDPVVAVADRMRYLEQRVSVSRDDLTTRLESWLAGAISAEELVLWASEMAVVGEVSDWQSPSGEEEHTWSYLAEVFHTFSQSFHHVDVGNEVDACERGHLAKTIVPTLLTHLAQARPVDEAAIDALDDLFDPLYDC